MVQNKDEIDKIRLARPYVGKRKKLMALIEEVLASGYFTQGKYVMQLEQQIAEYLKVENAIAVNSGTAALHLSLIALGIGFGDEVIVPAYTFPATANVVELVGAKPVLVDVDMDTYNINVEKVESSISPSTKAIMPVHLFGNPASMNPIMKIARTHKLKVIEDAAGAFGSKYGRKECGTIGDVGCYSFHPRKIITTGEGGLVVTKENGLAQRLRVLRDHGLQKTGAGHDFIAAGFNYRMNELEAVLGVNQMSEIDRIIDERQELAKRYMTLMGNLHEIAFQRIPTDSTSVWQAFVIRLRKRSANSALKFLQKQGIEANIGTYALHLLRYYRSKYRFKPSDYPIGEKLHRMNLALPFYNGMPVENMKKVAKTLERIAR